MYHSDHAPPHFNGYDLDPDVLHGDHEPVGRSAQTAH
jgi:hypothetical protein